MEEQIAVSIDRIKKIIDKINKSTFTTADILRKYSGSFHSNINTPPAYSFNAQFGKLLKRNESKLQINEVRHKVNIKDDCGNKTTTSEWKLDT